MNPKRLLFEALELPADARAAFLEEACAGDAALRARVDALLAAHDAADARLGAGTPDLAQLAGAALGAGDGVGLLRPGDHVGAYELVEVLGEGGFGTVYRARQERPVQREVALKVVKAGMDTAAVLQRFETERQALALMDHPSIARVLEVGATDGGRPYFAMELVHGEHLTRYARARRLDLRARLRLFLQVCQALQHAHQKGVVHRDVKAGNVLVTEVDGEPVPKIIDFGIAKAVRGGALSADELTGEGHLLGTPSTMSPEQLAGGPDVDTRADVYALGLLLYELLTDAPAFDLATRSLDEIRRVVRDVQPTRPSRRRAARAEADAHESRARVRLDVPADLDWICLRCLEKDRDRRYATALGLAQDVERFLAHMPVEAAPPSALYRARKLLRRHRGAALLGGVLLLGLLTAVVGLEHGRRLAAREAAEARRQARLARSVLRFFTDDLLAAAVPSGQPGRGRDVRVLDVLRLADARLERGVGAAGLPDDPLVETALRRSLGQSWAALGQFEPARAQLASARDRALAAYGTDAAETLHARRALADVLRAVGELDAADAELDALEAALARPSPRGVDTAADDDARRERDALALSARRLRGGVLLERGEVGAAVALLEALADEVAARGEASDAGVPRAVRLELLEELGLAYVMAGDYARGGERFAGVHAERAELLGPRDPFTLVAQLNHGNALRAQDHLDEARAQIDAAVAGLRAVLGARHPDTLVARHAQARLALDAGELDLAGDALTELRALTEQAFGEDHAETLDVLSGLFTVHYARGELEAAEALARETYARSIRALGADHPRTWQRANELAAALYARGRFDEVAPLVTANLAAQEAELGRDHPSTLQSLVNLALLRLGLEQYADAERLMRDAAGRFAARAEALPGPELNLAANFAGLLVLRERPEEAEVVARDALARLAALGLDDADLHGHLLERRAEALMALGRDAEAERELHAAWDALEPVFGADYPRARDVAAQLAVLLAKRGAPSAEQARWNARSGAGEALR